MLPIQYMPMALEDLRAIHRYIADNNLQAADRLIHLIRSKTDALRDYPKLGRLRPEIQPDIRSIATGNYVLLYRFMEVKIEIVRVVHASRDIIRLFE